jgi:putative aldouronate transport system substrate-binding protein
MSTNRINPNKFSVIASSTFNNLIGGHMDLDVTKTNNPVMSISNIFRNPDYVSQLRTIQKYKDLGYVSAAAGADQKFAVSVVKGGAELAKIYGEDYYMNVLEYPRISENDVCGSMFGVSSYSVNVARAMEIITAINTNSALRNILQYGVEEVHYQLDEDGNLTRLNNDYMMDVAKTGNMFIAYPPEGSTPDIWENAKTQNLEIVDDPFFGFFYEDLVDEALLNSVAEISKGYFEELENVPYEEFDEWVKETTEKLKENPIISMYVSFEDPNGLAAIYNEWFYTLYPNAMA